MAKRSYRDPEILERYTLWKASELHPEEFEVDRIAATKHQDVHDLVWYELNLADLIDRMTEDYELIMDHLGCAVLSTTILKEMPKELYPNLEEFLDKKDITPITLNGVSVPELMTKYNAGFYNTIQTISDWYNLGCPDNNYFRRWLGFRKI